MTEESEDFEFEYIDLDTIDQREDEDDQDPIELVRFSQSLGDEVFIVGTKL